MRRPKRKDSVQKGVEGSGESWVGVGEESGGAKAEVHEDTVGDSGVKWRRGEEELGLWC